MEFSIIEIIKLFQNLPFLQNLYLSYNQINKIPHDLFEDVTNLEVLDLNHNNLKFLDETIFKNLGNLKRLYLAYNRLEIIQINLLRNSQYLETLAQLGDLSHNKLTTLDERLFQNVCFLKHLHLNYNQIEENCVRLSVDMGMVNAFRRLRLVKRLWKHTQCKVKESPE
ncbi:connectin-like [Leptopilina heterotoma]|uniref:connectin-like n=1 Tax=Leptopilina heterotoma TaxID=63436 RepID=UPI001CA7CEE6|nr:connectin-like [Leptopilina heterotoma]